MAIAPSPATDTPKKLLAEALREHGAAPGQAPGLAILIVASVEGAIAMCRAKRTMEPLDQVARQLEALILGALDGRRDRRPGPRIRDACPDRPWALTVPRRRPPCGSP